MSSSGSFAYPGPQSSPLASDPPKTFTTLDRRSTPRTGGRRKPPELLHQIFELRARACPFAPAVEFGSLRITYRELDQRANQLAHLLIGRGVGRGSRVALMLPRSIEAYIAMLGVLKTGAAYVPIDPECPRDRAEFMLGDSGSSAIVSTGVLAREYWGYGRALIRMDADRGDLLDESEEPPPPMDGASRDLCYILYTSGASGHPKGVMIEHRNAVHAVEAEGDLFHVRPGDRVYQGSPLAFDTAVAETWLALRSGACVVAATPAMEHAGPELAHLLTFARVTVLATCPRTLRMLQDDVPTVHLLILHGEACPDELVRRWARPRRRIVRTYGPIESGGIAMWEELYPGRPATLGNPAPGCRVHLLDAQLHSLAPGDVGEIVIGGPGVARGYLNRQADSDDHFVVAPRWLGEEHGDRIFRSGDLGRLLDDNGHIQYLGRSDSQVTVDGCRIELAEVEAMLLECAGVRSAVCAVREDLPGLRRLVAYVVTATGALDESALKAELRRHLPDYMVPTSYVAVPEESARYSRLGRLARQREVGPRGAS